MSGLRKLFNIVQNLDPLILQGILADQPYLMRLCELELGPEDSEDETIEFTGSVEIKRVYFHEDLPMQLNLQPVTVHRWTSNGAPRDRVLFGRKEVILVDAEELRKWAGDRNAVKRSEPA